MNLSYLLLNALVVGVNATPLYKRETAVENPKNGFVKYKFIQEDILPDFSFNAIPVTFGSDNQTILLKLDTTTSDFWVNSDVNEYCLAYYSIPDYFNTTSIEWNQFNDQLRSEYQDTIDKFEVSNIVSLNSLVKPTGSSLSVNINSYLSERNTAYASLISAQKKSITEKIDGFLKTATKTIDQDWNLFTSAVSSDAENLGHDITSKGGLFATTVTSFGENFATKVTSVGGKIFTVVTATGEAIASDVTSVGGRFASHVTSAGGQFASDVTSDFGDVTSDVVNGWDKFTSGAVDIFGGLKKRENAKEGWEKFTRGADEFFEGDLRKRENAKEGWEKFTRGADEFFEGDLKKREDAEQGWEKFTSGADQFFDSLKKRETFVDTSLPMETQVSRSHSASSVRPVAYSSTYEITSQETSISAQNITNTTFTSQIDSIISNDNHDCSLYGVFNDSSSSSFELLSGSSFMSTGDDFAVGFIGNDTIQLSNMILNATFGVADVSESNIGVLGIGQSNDNSTFKSFPYVLAENGDIFKPVYSLAIGSNESSIIFGAVDYGMIVGNISFFPLLNDTDAIALNLSGLNVTIYDNTTDSYDSALVDSDEIPAIISTVTNQLFLPNGTLLSLVDQLNSSFQVDYHDFYRAFILTLDDENDSIDDITINFDFQGTVYDILISSFLLPLIEDETYYFNYSAPLSGSNSSFYYDLANDFDEFQETNTYILSILPSEEGNVVLGLDFLRDNLLTIVDLESKEVGFAYTLDPNDSESFIVPIEDEIPAFFDGVNEVF